MFNSRTLCVALLLVTTSAVFAQAPKAKAKNARQPSPEFAPIQDNPQLPRVLLIGDSISIGYTLPVRELLSNFANVHCAPENCGPTTRGVQKIDQWLQDGNWDLIHFNFGLHDLKFVDDTGKTTTTDKGHEQVSLADYEKNLETIVTRMKKTGAKLIFATTTPVPKGEPQRVAGSEKAYNDVARKVMERHGVEINDLCEFCIPQLEQIQRPANVHFTDHGSQQLAYKVAEVIRNALKTKN